MNPFLSPDDWNARFGFTSNHDHKGEISIYSTSMLPCVWAGGRTGGSLNNVFCWKNWTYNGKTGHEYCRHHISSAPGRTIPLKNFLVERFIFPSQFETIGIEHVK